MTSPAPLTSAVALYALWVGCTYLLEGRPHTVLQPEATALRLGYTLTANVLIGTGLAGWFLRRLSRAGVVTPSAAGFSGGGHAVAASGVGAGVAGLRGRGPGVLGCRGGGVRGPPASAGSPGGHRHGKRGGECPVRGLSCRP
jgi:hypothetical protein